MSSNFELIGAENLKRIIREFPENGYIKPVKAAFRKAADPVKKAIVTNLPGSLKGLKKAVKIKPGKGKSLTMAVGIYSGNGVFRNTRGQDWDPYMIAYWHNYGTLSNRDREHSFKKQRRSISADFQGGIRPQRFVERAWDQSKTQAQKEFEKKAVEEVDKFLKQNALR